MTWQHWVRLSVFLIFAAFMTVGPFYSQLLGGSRMLFRAWVMFSGYGSGIEDARFTQLLNDGTEVALNPYELLEKAYDQHKTGPRRRWFYRKWPKWNTNPQDFWRVHKRTGGAVKVARRLCEVLGSGSIRIDSRVGTRRGWVPALKGKVIRCDGQSVTE